MLHYQVTASYEAEKRKDFNMKLYNFLTAMCCFYAFSAMTSCAPENGPNFSIAAPLEQFSQHLRCSQKRDFYEQPRLRLEDRLNLHSDFSRSEIVLMSVEHNNFENVVYPYFIEAMAQNGRRTDCFLLERAVEDAEEKQFIDAINRGETVDWDSMEGHFDLTLLRYLSREGIKIIPIDTDQYSDLEDTASLNARDRNFANRIEEILDSSTCKKPFFPVGGAHLASGVNGRRNLAQLLTERNISNSKAGLIIQGVQSSFAPEDVPGLGLGWSWRKKDITMNHLNEINMQDFVCPSLPSLGGEEFYTLSGAGQVAPTYYDPSTDSFLGSSADAEFWIAYTCQTALCRQANNSIQQRLNNLGIPSF